MAGEVTTRRSKARVIKTTIALGEATSTEIDVGSLSRFSIVTPAALTHATIGILVATVSGGTALPLYDGYGNGFSLAATINRTYLVGSTLVNPADSFQYIKLQMGTPGTPATEAAARTFYIIGK
jgi:hypothetical protein